MSKSLPLALIIALAASSVSAAALATEQSATETVAKKKKPKKICKADNSITGSRIAKRICKTQEEWDAVPEDQEVRQKSQNY